MGELDRSFRSVGSDLRLLLPGQAISDGAAEGFGKFARCRVKLVARPSF